MKKLLFILIMLPTLCFAQAQYVAAGQMGNPQGSTCKVLVSEYRPGSGVEYLGTCGWYGLKGIAAYVQGWNHSNHIRVVRGEFSSGKPLATTKVMYINMISKKVSTYYENEYQKTQIKVYNLDDIVTDAIQAGVLLNGDIISYVSLANYIDVLE